MKNRLLASNCKFGKREGKIVLPFPSQLQSCSKICFDPSFGLNFWGLVENFLKLVEFFSSGADDGGS